MLPLSYFQVLCWTKVSLKWEVCPSRAGSKRPASSWRDTRSRQSPGGADLHDDFLDTPLENIRGNLNKATKEKVRDLPVAAPKYKNVDSSNDETQVVNVYPAPQKQQMPGPMTGKEVSSMWNQTVMVKSKISAVNIVRVFLGIGIDDMMLFSTSAHPSLDLIACHLSRT
ncbi:hypothetical protein QYF36_015036 [Acer negundo]|nr:hypothetical protein QYF36_015036 [Acer negundo]